MTSSRKSTISTSLRGLQHTTPSKMMSNAGAIRVPLYFFCHLDGKRIAGTVLSNTSKIFYTKNLLNFPEPSLLSQRHSHIYTLPPLMIGKGPMLMIG